MFGCLVGDEAFSSVALALILAQCKIDFGILPLFLSFKNASVKPRLDGMIWHRKDGLPDDDA